MDYPIMKIEPFTYPRQIVQIATMPAEPSFNSCIYALCNDGSLWALSEKVWLRLKDIPQDG